jgi:hypothetical protein
MADTHYEVDRATVDGREFFDVMKNLRKAWTEFANLRGVMIASKLDATDFTQVATRYGYSGADAAAKEANAEASFGEIDSAYGNGNAAIMQMLDRHL